MRGETLAKQRVSESVIPESVRTVRRNEAVRISVMRGGVLNRQRLEAAGQSATRQKPVDKAWM
ncbi:hypothetical protein GCM10012275_45630 [Longimycelium tulufanense]|uniref:Uncharacterized protein n=1 Tax=Longimycelium tulufanense TaxID=907463 RepID=A0A8J3CI28_9PSEU|nr:hypothetical protein GCM10012275_45630 [Longimycelium tulufanense]